MKRNSLDEGSRKISKPSAQSKASAISKQVLKSNPIPQQLVNKKSQTAGTAESTSALLKPKAQPLRSSKVSQKLVLFPQSSTEPESTLAVLPEDHEPLAPFFDTTADLRQQQQQQLGRGLQLGYMNNGEELPQTPSATDADFWRPHHATGVALPTEWTFGSRTAAERMPKDERDFAQLPRVAAYCTGEGYNLARLRPFLREHHHVSPRQYDEALYAAYHFPLMTLRPDKDNLWNIRVRSASPRPHVSRQFSSTDGSDLLQNQQQHHLRSSSNNMDILLKQQQDETYTSDPSTLSQQRRENEESEMNFDEDHLDQEGTPIIGSASPFPHHQQHSDHQQHMDHYHQHFDISNDNDQQEHPSDTERQHQESTTDAHTETMASDQQGQHLDDTHHHEPSYDEEQHPHHHHHHDDDEAHQTYGDHHQQEQQKDQDTTHPQPRNRKPFTGGEVFIFDYGVVVFWNFRRAEELLMLEDLAEFSIGPFRDNPDEDLQIEEMHFQYDTSQLKPRIFNDMITMKTGNHMIKLTLSHGLSQSAVLARYEDIMDKTIEVTHRTRKVKRRVH